MSRENKAEEKIIMPQAICEVCGKPCENPVKSPGKVYHWGCLYKKCEESRERLLKSKGLK